MAEAVMHCRAPAWERLDDAKFISRGRVRRFRGDCSRRALRAGLMLVAIRAPRSPRAPNATRSEGRIAATCSEADRAGPGLGKKKSRLPDQACSALHQACSQHAGSRSFRAREGRRVVPCARPDHRRRQEQQTRSHRQGEGGCLRGRSEVQEDGSSRPASSSSSGSRVRARWAAAATLLGGPVKMPQGAL